MISVFFFQTISVNVDLQRKGCFGMKDNKPWEPCPRCQSPAVTVKEKADGTGNIAGLLTIGTILVGSYVYGGSGFTFLTWIFLFPVILLVGALVGAVAQSLSSEKGHIATCKTCSYEWEIGEEEPEEADTSPAPSSQNH